MDSSCSPYSVTPDKPLRRLGMEGWRVRQRAATRPQPPLTNQGGIGRSRRPAKGAKTPTGGAAELGFEVPRWLHRLTVTVTSDIPARMVGEAALPGAVSWCRPDGPVSYDAVRAPPQAVP
jgi:hypothetical protein